MSPVVCAIFGAAIGVLFAGLFTGETQRGFVEVMRSAWLLVRHPRQWWANFREDWSAELSRWRQQRE